jgi:Tol biopolymer transport system component
VSRTFAALLLLVLALPASAAATGDIGRIAYTSDRDGNDEIYSARIDGFGEANLTQNPAADWSPAWSAEGGRIAFGSDRDGRHDIWVMNADGSDQHKVTSGDGSSSDAEPAWSPDGTSIVFASSRPFGQQWHLWVLELASGNLRQLTPGWGVSPSWSPDGTHVAYDGGGLIKVIDADGGDDRFLTACCLGPEGSPVWSPDGGAIVFGRYEEDWQTTNVRQLYFATATGGNVQPITFEAAYHGHPSFSPDGSMLVFQRQVGAFGNPELYFMSLTDLVPHPSVIGPGRNFVPSWGPTFVGSPPPPPAPPPPPPDTTLPTITILQPTASGTDRIDVYTVGQVVLADYSCTDDDSGVRHCMGPVSSGAPMDTRFVGTHEFRVFAADNAGNPVYRTTHYRVVYPFNGFAPPVVSGGWTEMKANDGVPLRFSIGGNYGLDVVTDARQQPIDCASGGPTGASSPAAGSLTYNASLDRYMFVWSSEKAWAGGCRSITLTLSDGTGHRADVRFTK